jgi:integrase/recombinase XerD
VAGGAAMLNDSVTTYLSVRRALGFRLYSTEKYLRNYTNFAEKTGDTHVISKTAVEWAAQAASESSRATRMDTLIRFSRFAQAEDGRHEIPPNNVFCGYAARPTPYIFTDEEVKQLILEARRLGPPSTLRPHTYSTLLGLLASTGLRISEALSLRFQDLTPDGLIIRETKFFKRRLVPLHESVIVALGKYVQRRRKFISSDDHIFISGLGSKLGYYMVAKTFQKIAKAAGIMRKLGGPKPRLHSFRHRFAVKALLKSPDTRDRISQHMLALSTYMGHSLCLFRAVTKGLMSPQWR